MVKNKHFHIKNWDELIILLEDHFDPKYGLTPTEALDIIYKHFKQVERSGYFWKLTRFNMYLTQRAKDTKRALQKLDKEAKKYKNFKELKKRFVILCGKENKRIETVRRTVKSEKYAENFKKANFQRIKRLEELNEKKYQTNNKFQIKSFKVLEGDHLAREIIQLNKLICDQREDKYFDAKLLFGKADKETQFRINLLR